MTVRVKTFTPDHDHVAWLASTIDNTVVDDGANGQQTAVMTVGIATAVCAPIVSPCAHIFGVVAYIIIVCGINLNGIDRNDDILLQIRDPFNPVQVRCDAHGHLDVQKRLRPSQINGYGLCGKCISTNPCRILFIAVDPTVRENHFPHTADHFNTVPGNPLCARSGFTGLVQTGRRSVVSDALTGRGVPPADLVQIHICDDLGIPDIFCCDRIDLANCGPLNILGCAHLHQDIVVMIRISRIIGVCQECLCMHHFPVV